MASLLPFFLLSCGVSRLAALPVNNVHMHSHMHKPHEFAKTHTLTSTDSRSSCLSLSYFLDSVHTGVPLTLEADSVSR